MNETAIKDSAEKTRQKDEQLAALLASASIGAFFAWYWTGQIQSTLELLRMAYG